MKDSDRTPNVNLAGKRQMLVAQLSQLPSVADRLAWLIEQARVRPMLPVEERIEANRVPGCLARLWLTAEFREGRCHFRCDSDSLIVKAVAGLLCDFYSGELPADILQHNPDFLARLGIDHHISPNRRNALSSVWRTISTFAEQNLGARTPGLRQREGR